MPTLMPTTVVGSYPQPRWLIDHELLMAINVPRARLRELWRVPEPYLESAQDDATRLAIRDMELAGIDIITDGEIRRESYSNRFATSLDGVVAPDLSADAWTGTRRPLPVVVGPIRRTEPVEVRDLEFLRGNTDRQVKITLPGPFTMAQLVENTYYDDRDELIMDLAAAVNAEVRDLRAAGADVIQLDEPWLRNDPETAERIAVQAIDAAFAGVDCATAVHLCFGYAARVEGEKPTAYKFLAQLTGSTVDQISIEAAQPGIDLGVLADLASKKIILGVIDLADQIVESAATVAERIRRAVSYVAAEQLIPAPDCGMKYLDQQVAFSKLRALAEGTALVRAELG